MSEKSYLDRLDAAREDPVWDQVAGIEKVKDRSRVFTASQIKTMSQCLYQWYLAYVLKAKEESKSAATARGTMIHKTVADLHAKHAWNHWEDLLRVNVQAELDSIEEQGVPWKREVDPEDYFIADSAGMIKNYVDRNRDAQTIGVEVPFRMVLTHPRTGTSYPLVGTVDRLDYDKTGKALTIVDWKTGQTPPDDAFLARDYQMSGYGLAAKNGIFVMPDGEPLHFDAYPERIVWYQMYNLLPYKRAGTKTNGTKYVKGDLRGEPEIDVVRRESDYDAFRADICNAIRGIRMGIIWKSGAGFPGTCAMCRYRSACVTGEYVKSGSSDLADMVIEDREEGVSNGQSGR